MVQCTCLYCGKEREHESRGLCSHCYQVARATGEIDQYPARLKGLDDWIACIDTSDPDACWPWPGPMNTNGYGNSSGPAHRAVYARMVAPIPEGQQIDHACHNEADCSGGKKCPHRRCVNWVSHLRISTVQNNLLASPNTVNAINVAKTHCPQNHAYDEDNTAVRNGRRHCKRCARDRRRARYHANIETERAMARDRQRIRRAGPVAASGAKQA